MSEQQTQSSQSSETRMVSKEVHIQEGYTPPPMAIIHTTMLVPDDIKGYTPPPMPTMVTPQVAPTPTASQPTSSQPTNTQAPSNGAAATTT